MSITLNGDSGITTPTYGGTVSSEYITPVTSFKNRIINPGMAIDQRNAGASVTPTDGAYTLDRWIFEITQSSKFTAQQNAGSVTPPAGFTNYLGITSSSAYSVVAGDYFLFSQFIEGLNTYDLAWGTASASPVTLSFWVRSSLTGTFGGSLENSGGSRSYVFSYTINSANTWEQKTITIAGDTTGTWLTTNGRGISCRFSFGTGSTWTKAAGSWSATRGFGVTGGTSVVGVNGATFYITGVQLEKGSTATSFDYRPYGTELNLCQRYYYKYEVDGSSGSIIDNLYICNTSDNYRRKVIESPVIMRAFPTLITTTSSGTPSYQWYTTKGGMVYVNAGNTTTEVTVSSATLSAEL